MSGTPIATSDIVAQAFLHLELGDVSSFGDDSEQARDAGRHYPRALRACLEYADWSFASEIAELPEASPEPAPAADPLLPHLYVLPPSFVALRQVLSGETAWRIDRRYLRADAAAPLTIRFTAMTETEAQLPAEFQEAVALRLALMMSSRWLPAVGKRDRIRGDAADALALSARHDARHASPVRWDGRARQADWADEARL